MPFPAEAQVPESNNILISISRQLGAGGAVLGQRLASRLGFAYLDREILRLAAERAGVTEQSLASCDERISGFWERLIDSFAVGPPENVYTSVPGPPSIRDQRLFEIESRVIHEVAQRRNAVVIGRGSFWMLREHPGLIRVFLHAPPAARVPTVRAGYKLSSDADARKMIDRVDAERARFIEAMTGRTLTDARNYDLSINTHCVSLAAAEEMIAKLVEERRERLSARP